MARHWSNSGEASFPSSESTWGKMDSAWNFMAVRWPLSLVGEARRVVTMSDDVSGVGCRPPRHRSVSLFRWVQEMTASDPIEDDGADPGVEISNWRRDGLVLSGLLAGSPLSDDG